jgi:AraC-like DNA-binding protein
VGNLSRLERECLADSCEIWYDYAARYALSAIQSELRIMQPFLETLEPSPQASFHWKRFALPAFTYGWHFHPEVELTLILKGQGKRFIGDDIANFTPGDLCLLGPNLPHTWLSDLPHATQPDAVESIVIQFRLDCFGEGFFDRPELLSVSRVLTQSAQGLQFDDAVSQAVAPQMIAMQAAPPLGRMMALLSMLDQLAAVKSPKLLSSRGFAPSIRDSDATRIDQVSRFILEHVDEPLTLEDIADVAHLSPSAFSRFFKRATGKNFVRYVNELRVAKACRRLTETDDSIAAIAFESGFGNLANFNRRFKEIKGTQPREFRAHFRERVG